ncbi:MAG: hypothetical protein V7L23_33320 [Nostoc sp.]
MLDFTVQHHDLFLRSLTHKAIAFLMPPRCNCRVHCIQNFA